MLTELINGPHPQRVAARQKLTRLSNSQFHELAMDVYDEVVRRTKDDKYGLLCFYWAIIAVL